MEYNTNLERLVLPDYGRNIQNMVKYAMSLTDRDERQRCAETIISIMATKVPQQKNPEEQQRMLWDHLALISGYRLDVDSPYPINIQTAENQPRPHLDYPNTTPEFRHYGHTLEQMAKALVDMPEGEERHAATLLVLAQMAKSLYTWNRNVLSPEKLVDDISHLTGGAITPELSRQEIATLITAASTQPRNNNSGAKKKKK